MTGTAGLLCETDATIMIRIELPMPIADAQTRRRATLGGVPGCSGLDEPVPVAAAVAELTLPARHFPV
jgi:hypothetical protein